MQAQERNQELLEALWSASATTTARTTTGSNLSIQNTVNKYTISRRNEVGVPPTPWMQNFVLNDPRKSDEENDNNITNSMFDKNNIIQGSWQRLPGITKEQEEKWHNGLVGGLKKEKEEEKEEEKGSRRKGKSQIDHLYTHLVILLI